MRKQKLRFLWHVGVSSGGIWLGGSGRESDWVVRGFSFPCEAVVEGKSGFTITTVFVLFRNSRKIHVILRMPDTPNTTGNSGGLGADSTWTLSLPIYGREWKLPIGPGGDFHCLVSGSCTHLRFLQLLPYMHECDKERSNSYLAACVLKQKSKLFMWYQANFCQFIIWQTASITLSNSKESYLNNVYIVGFLVTSLNKGSW